MTKQEPADRDNLEELVGESMSDIAEERARASADGRRDAERRAARAARRRMVAMVLVPACLLLTALNLSGLDWTGTAAAPATLTEEEARAAAMQLLSDAAEELQVYRQENGSYPQVPGFIGPDGPEGEDEPFHYELLGPRRYVVSVTVEGATVSFDSRDNAQEVFREVRGGR